MAKENDVRKHAREFVAQLEREDAPTQGGSRLREIVMAIVSGARDEEVAQAREYVRNWMQASAVRRDAYDKYGSLHDPDTELGEGESPGAGLALSAAYQHAAGALEQDAVFQEVQKHFRQPETLARDIRKGLPPVKEGFGGELLLEAATMRRDNPLVARGIDNAKEEIRGLIGDLKRDRERNEGPAAYGFVIEWGSEVLDAIAVGIAVAVVVVVVVAAIL